MFSLPSLRRPVPRPARLRLGVLGLSRAQVSELHQAVESANTRAPLAIELHPGRGELALVEGRLAAGLDGRQWETLFGQTPVVALVEPGVAAATLRTPYRLSTHFDDHDLLATLGSIPELRRRGFAVLPRAGQRLDPLAAQPPFVAALLRGYVQGRGPVLTAGYANGDSLLVDFARRQVIADRGAWESLRSQRELPRCPDEGFEPAGLLQHATTHGLDVLVWSVGLAAGSLPLLGAPDAWRSAPIRVRSWARLKGFLHVPVHLHLAESIAAGVTTPDRLRRATRADVRELRAFLQAGLFLQALEWVSAG